jgi:parallel beta-helix repeat protein
VAHLIDADGTDRYDDATVTCLDCTVPNKGAVGGNQIDSDDTGLPITPPGPPVEDVDFEDCAPHPPIEITENQGPEGFALDRDPATGQPVYRPGSGVVAGSGTAEDPYVIPNWCIASPAGDDGALLPTAAIRIANTDAHVEVRGVEIDGERPNPSPDPFSSANLRAGIQIEDAQNVTVNASRVADANDGMRVTDSSSIRLTGNELVENTVSGLAIASTTNLEAEDNQLTANAVGLHVEASTGLELASNEVYQSEAVGVFFDRSQGNLLSNNTIEANRGDGLRIETPSPRNRLNRNTVLDNGGDGIELTGADANRLDNNTVNGNDRRGIHVRYQGDDNILLHNTIRQNGLEAANRNARAGLVLDRTEGSTIRANELSDNRRGLAVLDPREDAGAASEIRANNLETNIVAGLDATRAEARVDVRENWWGDATGPSGGVASACSSTVADGDGQPILASEAVVCFENWLTHPNSEAGVVPANTPAALEPAGAEPGDADQAGGETQIQRPTQEAPWPTERRGPDRPGAAPPAEPASVEDYRLDWNLTELTDEGETDRYSSLQVADVDPAPGNEIVASAPAPLAGFGTARVGVYAANGTLLWQERLDGASAGSPLTADLDADGRLEVFFTSTNKHIAFDQHGERLWTTEYDQATIDSTDGPAGLDVNGDGAMDVVQTAKGGASTDPAEENVTAKIFALDGRTGELLFEERLACRDSVPTRPILHQGPGGPRIVQSCGSQGQEPDRGQVNLVESYTITRANGSTTETDPQSPPYRLETEWSRPVSERHTWVRNVVRADVLPNEGHEILATWQNDTIPIGVTVFARNGTPVTSHPLPGIGRNDPYRGSIVTADFDGQPGDELVAQVPPYEVRAYEIQTNGSQELFSLPTQEEKDAEFVPSEEPVDVGPLMAGDLGGDGQPELVAGWRCNLDCGDLHSSVRIYDASGNLSRAWDIDTSDPLTAVGRGGAIAPVQDPAGSNEVVIPAFGQALVFSPEGR